MVKRLGACKGRAQLCANYCYHDVGPSFSLSSASLMWITTIGNCQLIYGNNHFGFLQVPDLLHDILKLSMLKAIKS